MSSPLPVTAGIPVSDWRPGHATTRLRIEIAGRSFLFRGIPDGWQATLPARLADCVGRRSNRQPRTIDVRMSFDERLRPSGREKDLNKSSRYVFEPETVRFLSDWLDGSFGLDSGSPAELEVHVGSYPWFAGVIENFLRLLVAYDVLSTGGVLLHSAAVVRQGRAAILFGHSGAGKSTSSAVALQAGCSVISDDINVIEPAERGWQVTPVPFSGTLNGASDIVRPVPLAGLFRLHQAESDALRWVSQARGLSLLAGSAPFVNRDAHRSGRLFEVLGRLAGDVPVADLDFTRSPEFLRHVFPANRGPRDDG